MRKLFFFRRSLCGVLLFLTSFGSVAQEWGKLPRHLEDGPSSLRVLAAIPRGHLLTREYAEAERSFSQLNSPEQRLLDGRWKLSAFGVAVQDFIVNGNLWQDRQERIKEWRKEYPRSSAAAAAEAMYWRLYAWHARGGGFASSVTKEGQELFHDRLRVADEVLRQSKDFGPANPLWYSEYLEVALASGWPLAEFRKLFEEAVAKTPSFYPYYFAMVARLQPKWGGNYNLIDEFAMQSVAKTQATEGTSMYARIYWAVDQGEQVGFDLFKDTKANWPRLRQAFEDLQARTPGSYWNMNAFASFACRAGDGKTYTKLRSEMGDRVFPEAWRSNYSLDLCDHKFPRVKG